MNDRELLELAANAAGYRITFGASGDPYIKDGINTRAWNPIIDDGDALRLSVRLKLQIIPGTYNKDEFVAFDSGVGSAYEYLHFQQDDYAACRRAVVRVAAEIGKRIQINAQR